MILTDFITYTTFQPGSALSGDQFNYYAQICSNAIENYLNRDFDLSTNIEHHWSDESNVIILDKYPVNDIYMVTQGTGLYGSMTLTDTAKPVTMQYDNTNVKLTYDLGSTQNLFTVSAYNTVTDLISALDADIENETGGTITYTIPSDYANISPSYLSDISYTIGADNTIFELQGFDFNNQLRFTLESDRVLQFANRLIPGSNSIMVKYNSGYATVSDLPNILTDICNRMIRDLYEGDQNFSNGFYAKEKLGNAEISNWSWDVVRQQTQLDEIILKYKYLLDKFKKIDIAFY